MTNPIDGLKFDLGLGSYPFTPLASVSWTDVTSDVLLREGVSFNRGRGSQDDAASPGRLTFTLNNGQASGKSVGRWTRNGANVTGGWDLRVPVRVRHTTHGTLWVGYVDAAEAGWENGVRPVVRVQASDRLAQFARVKLAPALIAEQDYDDPIAAWTLDNPVDTTVVPERTGRYGCDLTPAQLGEGGTLAFGEGSLSPDALTMVDLARLSSTDGQYLAGTLYGLSLGTAATIECWVEPNAVTYNGIVGLQDASGASWIALGTTVSGIPAAKGAGGTAVAGSSAVPAGEKVHLAVTLSYSAGTTTIGLYVNGASIGTTTASLAIANLTTIWVGRDRNIGSPLDGKIAAVAVYNSALSASRIAAHYAAGAGVGDTTLERWERYCRLAGIDAADYDSTGTAAEPTRTMGAQPTNGKAYLSAAQECADVEDGVSFLDRTGTMRFHLRGVRIGAAVGLSLGPADVDADTVVLSDTDRVVNDVTVTREGGATQRVTNGYSVAYYGTQDDTLDLACETDEQALNVAEWIVYERAYPDERVDAVTVDLVSKAATVDVADALTADLSTRVQLTGMPTPSATSTLDLFVEGIADSITESSWRRTYTTSNATKRLDVFTLDDATLGVLDTGGVLA